MREYRGKSAKKYSQSESKVMALFPVVNRKIPKVNYPANFLDLGCGIGDYSIEATSKGYNYFGIDKSQDMIDRAKGFFPKLNFQVADSRNFSNKFSIKFDIILISMVFLTMGKRKDIVDTLKESKKVLNDNGKIIIGDVHPACDPYMQKHYFGRDDIECDLEGYFKSGISFVAHKKLSGGNFDFHDYHWTLKGYFDDIKEAGLVLSEIDECEQDIKLRHIDPKYFDKYRLYPTYLVMVCKKPSNKLLD